MRSGDLKHRIELQTPSKSQNSFGEWIETFATVATVWAAIIPLTGSKYLAAKQANSDVSGTVYIRYRSDIVPTMRLKYGNRILKIVSVIITKEKKNQIEILYKEGLD
jgi:SPP1 family predicted phage head-tail adaptor